MKIPIKRRRVKNDGIELMEEDGLYRTVTFDNYPIYYSVGKVTIPLPDAIKNSDTTFNCNNSVITVRQEQIVQIIRYWIP